MSFLPVLDIGHMSGNELQYLGTKRFKFDDVIMSQSLETEHPSTSCTIIGHNDQTQTGRTTPT
jgi:hypothetical protein